MSVIRWLGGTSEDPTVAGNYEGASVPVSGDTLILEGTPTNKIGGGDLSAVNLAALIETPTYTLNMASSGAPLEICADKMILRGQGLSYIKSGSGGTTATDLVYVEKALRTGGVQLSDEASSSFTTIIGRRGLITLSASLSQTITEVIIGQAGSPDSDCTLWTVQGCANITRFIQAAGHSYMQNNAVTAVIPGGECTWEQDTVTGVLYIGNASVRYNSTATLALVIGASRGILDMLADGRAKNITKIILENPMMFLSEQHVTIPAAGDLVAPGVIHGFFTSS